MTKTASARATSTPASTAPAASPLDDGRLKLQALAAPVVARRANWELRSLGAPGFELASARG
jgi:hypothetical protein